MVHDKDDPTGPDNSGPEITAEGITFPGVDIYASWALDSGCGDCFPSEEHRNWLPVLFELKGISAENFVRGFLSPGEPLLGEGQTAENWHDDENLEIWRQSVHVPGLFLKPVEPFAHVEPTHDKTYLTALIFVGSTSDGRRQNFFDFLKGGQNPTLEKVFSRCTIGSPLDNKALRNFEDLIVPTAPPQPPNAPPEEGTVVVGIIDDGIAFVHERFRRALHETRIEYVWLQGEYFNSPNPPDDILAPADILEGREVRKHDKVVGSDRSKGIDTLLSEATSAGSVDEHLVYEHFGVEDFGRVRGIKRKGHKSTAQRASHGAHVADVAAGYPMADSRNDRPMICVQLPTEITADTSGQNLEPYLFAAVQYILRRADAIAVERNCGHLPVVINFSYGGSMGPHDGTSSTERGLDQIITERSALAPLRIVLPSGNSHLSRTHAQVSFRPDDDPPISERTLLWRVQPNDKSASFLEIWLPRGTPDSRISVKIVAPGTLGEIELIEITESEFNSDSGIRREDIQQPGASGDDIFFSVQYAYDAESNRGVFLVKIAPTERLYPADGVVAPPGVWTVTLENQVTPSKTGFGEDDLIHAWIQRDDTPFGYPIYGRQSYFDDEPDYRRYTEGGRPVEQDSVHSDVKRAGTISGLATGDETIVVGGVYRREMRAAEYAAGGPTYDADRVGPDASAVSDDTRVHRGILAAGTRSGSRVVIGGTSVAAPQIARWVADELASGSNTGGDRTAVKNRAIIEETTPPERPPRPTHERGGAGRIIRPPIASVDRFER